MASGGFPPGLTPAQIAELPAGQAPDGINDFNSTDSIGYQYNTVSGLVLGITIVCVFLRLYARAFHIRALWWDDLSCVIAILCQSTYSGLLFYLCNNGLGQHIWNLRVREVLYIVDLSQVVAIITEPCIFFTKLTLLLLYYKVFSRFTGVRIAILIGIASCFVFYTTIMFIYIFTKTRQDIQIQTNQAVAVVNVVSDFYILIIPIVSMSKLQLPMSRKLGALGVFLTGGLACAMGIVGLVYRFRFNIGGNITRDLIPVFIVNTVETDVGIMCACMPCFPILFRSISASISSRYGSGSNTANTHSHPHSRPWASRGTNRSSKVVMSKGAMSSSTERIDSRQDSDAGTELAEVRTERAQEGRDYV